MESVLTVFKLVKYLFLFLPYSLIYANNSDWLNFDNNLYFGGAFAINNASVDQLGVSSNNFGALQIGTSALFETGIYFNLEGAAKFTEGGSFINNWYSGTFKLGYSLEPTEYINFTPYLSIGYGNQGAFYSSISNVSYGLGVLSEAMLNQSLSLYLDVWYQLQNYTSSINNDFNQNVLNNFTLYSLSGTPTVISASIGLKYVALDNYFLNPFFKFENYQQSFVPSGGSVSYGSLTPIVSQYIFGLNFGLSI